MDIRERLFSLGDPEYREFHARLVPTIDPERIIGVRMPALRAFAKEIKGTEEAGAFLKTLPHDYYDENTLHGILVSMIKDPEECIRELDAFLPYVDNWATCDVISPAAFKKHPPLLLPKIGEWMASDRTFTIRFGIETLMSYYLDEAFSPEYPARVAAVRSEEYYVRMMIAWYFATALAKQPEACMPYLLERRLDPWTHNMTIRKACESFRIAPEMKAELKRLRVREPQEN